MGTRSRSSISIHHSGLGCVRQDVNDHIASSFAPPFFPLFRDKSIFLRRLSRLGCSNARRRAILEGLLIDGELIDTRERMYFVFRRRRWEYKWDRLSFVFCVVVLVRISIISMKFQLVQDWISKTIVLLSDYILYWLVEIIVIVELMRNLQRDLFIWN